MKKLFLDIETRSKADLPVVGAWKYAEHDSTDIMCLAYKAADWDNCKLWVLGEPMPDDFNNDWIYVAHNALFEYAHFKLILVDKLNWPEKLANPDNWECTMNMCRCVGMPGSLSNAAKVLNLTDQKLVEGEKLIKIISIPVKKKGNLVFNTPTENELQAFYNYCKHDVIVTEKLYNKVCNTENYEIEKAIQGLDRRQNISGIPIDLPMVKAVKAIVDNRTEYALKEAEKYHINVKSPKQMKDYFNNAGIYIENTQAKTLNDIKKKPGTPEHIKKLIDLRFFLTRASVKKIDAVLNRISPDNRLRYNLMYHGALTGRWSGQGFQPHNLTKTETTVKEIEQLVKELKNDTLDFWETMPAMKKVIPGFIKAEKDKTFLMGDFSAIEARVLAFLSGQLDLLKDFVDGIDIYKKLAASIYNKDISEITKMERQLGKQGILLSGYGGGWKSLFSTCNEKYDMAISADLAKKTTENYRKKYNLIVKFWYDLERAFNKARTRPGIIIKCGYVSFIAKGNHVQCILPSGRAIYYHRVQLTEDGLTYINHARKNRAKLYGGLLAENVCQAVARDILTNRMLECDKAELNPILHVHDEILCHIDKTGSKEKLQIFNNIMNTEPCWLSGFPLSTECEITKRYYK